MRKFFKTLYTSNTRVISLSVYKTPVPSGTFIIKSGWSFYKQGKKWMLSYTLLSYDIFLRHVRV